MALDKGAVQTGGLSKGAVETVTKGEPLVGTSFTDLSLKATPGGTEDFYYKTAHRGNDYTGLSLMATPGNFYLITDQFTELVSYGFQGIPYEFEAKSAFQGGGTILPFVMQLG